MSNCACGELTEDCAYPNCDAGDKDKSFRCYLNTRGSAYIISRPDIAYIVKEIVPPCQKQ